jgi:hypothetical protein
MRSLITGIPHQILSCDQIEKNEMGRACSKQASKRELVGKPGRKKPLGRPRRRWEDNIKLDLQEVGWGTWTALMWLKTGTGGGLL